MLSTQLDREWKSCGCGALQSTCFACCYSSWRTLQGGKSGFCFCAKRFLPFPPGHPLLLWSVPRYLTWADKFWRTSGRLWSRSSQQRRHWGAHLLNPDVVGQACSCWGLQVCYQYDKQEMKPTVCYSSHFPRAMWPSAWAIRSKTKLKKTPNTLAEYYFLIIFFNEIFYKLCWTEEQESIVNFLQGPSHHWKSVPPEFCVLPPFKEHLHSC